MSGITDRLTLGERIDELRGFLGKKEREKSMIVLSSCYAGGCMGSKYGLYNGKPYCEKHWRGLARPIEREVSAFLGVPIIREKKESEKTNE